MTIYTQPVDDDEGDENFMDDCLYPYNKNAFEWFEWWMLHKNKRKNACVMKLVILPIRAETASNICMR